jgi:glycosyltransferase involved in cell wall biosynthesis
MNKNKVILHISANQFPDLSSTHHTKNIWKELSKDAKEYHILARATDNRFYNYQENNIYLHLVPAITKRQWSFFFTSLYLKKLVRKYNINVLLAQCPIMGGFYASHIALKYKIPLMVEIHGDEYFRYSEGTNTLYKILNKIQNITFSRANVIRSLSPKMSQKISLLGFKDKVKLIPNRVNLNIFNQQKIEYGIKNKVKLISVGRFVKAKNYETLIKVCLSNNLNLCLIGGGELKQQYLNLIPNDKKDDIVLIDWIEQKEMISLIINSDIYIQSSITEGVPRAILEAMALRMPIVSTNVGSIEGIIEDGVNGLIINNPLNEKEYIDKINQLTSDINYRIKLANRAYCDVIENYEWSHVFELYRNILYNM